ncbi:putative TIM-barrel fold metal-dependent hydrolase [Sphingobium xenophagum]|uniref:TIM-barrel fold metal-dependent hydrolase n=1 Tax=Sphingobium xenophagum TaxID=121428 RepID=A0ABU1X691_SPHXE|nr:amidohydrolase family protein [Sphingobium xenophagum]MDR7157103.1 putative TIM-barrel fold metal-dependent hydrolase [Sphingobium xenophagum]
MIVDGLLQQAEGNDMKLICIEEHTSGSENGKVTMPRVLEEAPYFALMSKAVPIPTKSDRPTRIYMPEAYERMLEIGEVRLKDMDTHGIDMQVISCVDAIQLAPKDQATELARSENDRIARAIAKNPDRFAGFATLPWQNAEAAVVELERAVKQLGLKGVLLYGRPGPGNVFADDPAYEPILAKLDEIRVPLFIHPGHPAPDVQKAYYDRLDPEVSAWLSLSGFGWHLEAGIQPLRLILSGTFDKYRNLQVISGHWGEMVPFFLARLDDMIPKAQTGLSRSITETYKSHVWVSPSGMFDLPHFEFIYKVIGADRIIWSVDYPVLTLNGTRAFLESLDVDQEDLAKMMYKNAEKLFGL